MPIFYLGFNESARHDFTNATASTDATTGALVVTGGVGVGGNIFGGSGIIANTTLKAGNDTNTGNMILDAPDANGNSVLWRTLGVTRWQAIKTGTTHVWQLTAFDAVGAVIDSPISIVNAAAGTMTLSRPLIFGATFKSATYTVAGLAALGGVAGMRAFVTDALAPAFGVAVAAGGAVGVPVYHDGTSWKVG